MNVPNLENYAQYINTRMHNTITKHSENTKCQSRVHGNRYSSTSLGCKIPPTRRKKKKTKGNKNTHRNQSCWFSFPIYSERGPYYQKQMCSHSGINLHGIISKSKLQKATHKCHRNLTEQMNTNSRHHFPYQKEAS